MEKLQAYEELARRGLIEQTTDDEAIKDKLNNESITFYIGFDPTSDSLHIGSLVPIMAMAFLQRHGHKPIALVGGATGMIGDPSGRDSERELMTDEMIEHNVSCIKTQLESFLSFEGDNAAIMTNNLDWFRKIGFIDCLRRIGKHFSVNAMINKESVRRRLRDRDHGISYTEFSYQILQAYDFSYLFKEQGCILQAGGSDQWGNITAGIDLIRRYYQQQAYGLTFPLVTTSSGAKFGKSAGNAIWLDRKRTSPYQFYQYWLQSDDSDVEKYLKYFSFLHPDEIDEIIQEHSLAPHKRLAQKTLATEVTGAIHGDDALSKAINASEVLFGGEIHGLGDEELMEIFDEVPGTNLSIDALATGIQFIDLLVETKICKSRGEARRLVSGGGGYLNNLPVEDVNRVVKQKDLASESVIILRSGKKKYHLVRFT